jgi:hypothetical protein
VEGVCSARTDAEGRYRIADMGAWGAEVQQPQRQNGGVRAVLAGCYFDVLHPKYGQKRPLHRSIPATVDVVLEPGATIEGTVIDQVTGKPAAEAWVGMQTTNDSPAGGGWREARTDASGKFRFTSLLAAKFNIVAEAPDRACAAIDSFNADFRGGKSTDILPQLNAVFAGFAA